MSNDKLNSGYNSGANKQQSGGGSGQQQKSQSEQLRNKVQDRVEQVHRTPNKK